MGLLDFLNRYYEKTTLSVRLQLFFLPLLIMVLIFQNIDFEKSNFSTKSIDLNRKNLDYDSNIILQKFEKFFSKNDIEIKSITFKKKMFFINLQVHLKEFLKTIDFIENINKYSNILSFTIQKGSDEVFDLIITIDFSKRYLKNNSKEDIQIKLNGIIGNRVNISGLWYKPKESVQGYIIQKIRKNSVVLIKKGQKLELKVKNEYFK
ncbi:MAG: hypothetical protein ACQERD_03550 [Campylobacterota bacterium]